MSDGAGSGAIPANYGGAIGSGAGAFQITSQRFEGGWVNSYNAAGQLIGSARPIGNYASQGGEFGMSLVFRPDSVSQTVDALAIARNVAQIHQQELTIAVDESHQKQVVLDEAFSNAQNKRQAAGDVLKNKENAATGERAAALLNFQNAAAEEIRAKIAAEENAVKYIDADIMLNNGRIWWPVSADDANKATEYIRQRETDKASVNGLIGSDRNALSAVTAMAEKTKQDIERINNGDILDDYRPENEKTAEARAKAEADRDELFAKAGVKPAPAYTPQMVAEANAALRSPGAVVLNQTPGSVQMAMAGAGVWTAAGEASGSLTGAISRGISALLGATTASTAGPMVAAASTIFFSPPAGAGSDKVPGRDLAAMFALNAQQLASEGVKIEPGEARVNLPVRGQLVFSNGQLALQLLKTENGGIPAAVPVLNAVRDAATGLDKITAPALAGAPAQTILINPAPPPAQPSDTGNQQPVPVTPMHTGTEVKPVETITVTTTPAADAMGLQDFIYWRPDASGTGVDPVYVVLISPRDMPGKASGKGEPVGEGWLNNVGKDLGAPVPSQIADKLRGREFANFDAFRKAFWTVVGKDLELLKQFKNQNKTNVTNGKSPFVPESERVGGRQRFELHHVKQIKDNGVVYDVDNIRVMTPKNHIEFHKEGK